MVEYVIISEFLIRSRSDSFMLVTYVVDAMTRSYCAKGPAIETVRTFDKSDKMLIIARK